MGDSRPDPEPDPDPSDLPYEEAVRRSRLLREWSRTLRAWSSSTRRQAEASRLMLPSHHAPTDFPTGHRATSPASPPPQPPADEEVPLGEVPVIDLFVILVENHDFEVRDAVRRLTMAMLTAGYPADNDTVSATDAMDILESILKETRD
jgi:hypothetical protein